MNLTAALASVNDVAKVVEALAERVEWLTTQVSALRLPTKDQTDSSSMEEPDPRKDIDELFSLLEQLRLSKQLRARRS